MREAARDLRAVLVKASDFADNAGSLQHNAGHVDPEFLFHRIEKYAPLAEILEDAARTYTAHGIPHGYGEPGWDQATAGRIPASVTQRVTAMVTSARANWELILQTFGPAPASHPRADRSAGSALSTAHLSKVPGHRISEPGL